MLRNCLPNFEVVNFEDLSEKDLQQIFLDIKPK